MTSLRLHHPLYSNAVLVIELETPFQGGRPRPCPDCSTPEHPIAHARKSHHLRLDPNGDVMVHPDTYMRDKLRFQAAGLELANEVENAPSQQIGAVELPQRQIVDVPLNLDQTAATIYRPGRTKYESRDGMLAGLRRAISKEE